MLFYQPKTKLSMEHYHLVYDKSDDRWELKKQNAARATKAFETKEKGLDYAIDFLKDKQASLKIHKKDGTIQEERTYPRVADPTRTKG